MSHKTQIKTTLTNKKYLKSALDKLGFKYIEAEDGKKLKTKGRYGVHEDVDILIEKNGNVDFNNAVGFNKNDDGTYTAVGDFYGLRTANGERVTENMLKCEVTASSKEIETNERLEALMFSLDSDSRKENKDEISFTMQRWVD